MRYLTDEDRCRIWNEVWDATIQKMDADERRELNQMVESLSNYRRLRNFGRKASRELLTVLGIWMVTEAEGRM